MTDVTGDFYGSTLMYNSPSGNITSFSNVTSSNITPSGAHPMPSHHIRCHCTTSGATAPHPVPLHHIRCHRTTSGAIAPHPVPLHHIWCHCTTSGAIAPHSVPSHHIQCYHTTFVAIAPHPVPSHPLKNWYKPRQTVHAIQLTCWAPRISRVIYPTLSTYWHMCKCCVTYLLQSRDWEHQSADKHLHGFRSGSEGMRQRISADAGLTLDLWSGWPATWKTWKTWKSQGIWNLPGKPGKVREFHCWSGKMNNVTNLRITSELFQWWDHACLSLHLNFVFAECLKTWPL